VKRERKRDEFRFENRRSRRIFGSLNSLSLDKMREVRKVDLQ